MARQVLPVIGAAIGAYFGGAQGAQIGWTIGSIVGNAVDPVVIKGPSIGDIAQQTSQEGVPRPIVYGLSQPISGNIVVCGLPVIVTKKQQSGKGGPVTTSQSVYRTYAIAMCEGPINELVRCWNNGKLVYDARPGVADPGNAAFLAGARIFLGSFDQMPSADIESLVGSGNAPAMRGTAYVVFAHIDLTSVGGAVPQYVFQVLRCEGTLITSRPYAIEDNAGVLPSVDARRIVLWPQPYIGDSISQTVGPQNIYLVGSQGNYTNGVPDKVSQTVAAMDIELYGGEVYYSNGAPDKISSTVAPMSIYLVGDEVSYTIPTDDITGTVAPISITLSTP